MFGPSNEVVNKYFARHKLDRAIIVMGTVSEDGTYPVLVTKMPTDLRDRVNAKKPWLLDNGWNNELIVTNDGYA